MKEITGKELYEIIQQKNVELLACAMDDWDELQDEDQEVWEAVAIETNSVFAEAKR